MSTSVCMISYIVFMPLLVRWRHLQTVERADAVMLLSVCGDVGPVTRCVCVCERSIGLIACVQLDVLSDYDAVRLHGRPRDVALLGAFSGHL